MSSIADTQAHDLIRNARAFWLETHGPLAPYEPQRGMAEYLSRSAVGKAAYETFRKAVVSERRGDLDEDADRARRLASQPVSKADEVIDDIYRLAKGYLRDRHAADLQSAVAQVIADRPELYAAYTRAQREQR